VYTSTTGQLVDMPTRGLDISQSGQLADTDYVDIKLRTESLA